MSQLIGIGGRLTSGKDTVADYLVDNYDWVKIGMSEPLDEALVILDPLIPVKFLRLFTRHIRYSALHDAVGYTEAKKNHEVRRLLQKLGTDVGRKMFGENVWVDYASRKIDKLRSEGKSVILTGIRFPNEAIMISGNMMNGPAGQLVWVDRPDIKDTSLLTHASEAMGQEVFDIVLVNDGTLLDLYAKVEKTLV